METLVAGMILWIVSHTQYPGPQRPPTVRIVESQYLYDTMCGGQECSVVAMYLGGDAIYLDRRLRVAEPLNASFLLHEVVHYVQVKSGRYPNPDCPTVVAMEREAYELHERWLRERHRIWSEGVRRSSRRVIIGLERMCRRAASQPPQIPLTP